MFSLQRMLGKEDKFFTLLEAAAGEAQTSVQALVKLTSSLEQPTGLYDFVESRRKEKQIRADIAEAVYTTFVTALEREDIESLSYNLYRIPKTVEKFAQRLMLAPQLAKGVDFSKQITLLTEATETVRAMVDSLRKGSKLDKIKGLSDKLQYLEGEADRIFTTLHKEIYNGTYEAGKAMFLKDLYELLEKVIDRCRDVGNVVSQIVLKNS